MTTAIKNETILIVDDEEPIRRILKKMLSKQGLTAIGTQYRGADGPRHRDAA